MPANVSQIPEELSLLRVVLPERNQGSYRSGQLASWMRLHGFEDVHNVIDGMAAWRER